MKIIFTDTVGLPDGFKPQPAMECVPEWYKKMESYTNGEKKPAGDGNTTATIKRCMPVFDVITHGYIISTYVDVWVSQKEQAQEDGTLKIMPWYEWPSFGPIAFHPIVQAPTHPSQNGAPYPKWINPWGIKTPPGYSVLITAPVHRENIFSIMPGVVDTDTYTAPINFPMVLTNVKFEGLVPAGTPIAQVIPLQRESWQMSIGTEDDLIAQRKVSSKLRTRFFDSYKSQYRQIKEYK